MPRLIEEIFSTFQISKKNLVFCYKAVVNKILPDIKLRGHNFTPHDYINKFYDELNLSIQSRNIAVKVVEDRKKRINHLRKGS